MITSILTALLSLLFVKISLDVIKNRRSLQISLGAGKDDEILKYTSAHSNFAAYVPLSVILLYLIEASGMISRLVLIPLALVIFTGRFMHYKALTGDKMNFSLRVKSMKLTIFSLIAMSLILLVINIIKAVHL